MPDTHVQELLALSPEEAFEIYVNHMNTWWPRQGVFPYSFAPSSTRPHIIQFEPRQDGRYYETFADGTEYVIGRIQLWDPPHSLQYTWRDPTWDGETLISVRFAPAGNQTQFTYEQNGFVVANVSQLIPYYQIGCRQTMAAFFAHCQAVFELKKLESNL